MCRIKRSHSDARTNVYSDACTDVYANSDPDGDAYASIGPCGTFLIWLACGLIALGRIIHRRKPE
jgi:hypothetical protein